MCTCTCVHDVNSPIAVSSCQAKRLTSIVILFSFGELDWQYISTYLYWLRDLFWLSEVKISEEVMCWDVLEMAAHKRLSWRYILSWNTLGILCASMWCLYSCSFWLHRCVSFRGALERCAVWREGERRRGKEKREREKEKDRNVINDIHSIPLFLI